MKKMICILLAAALSLSLSAVGFAAPPEQQAYRFAVSPVFEAGDVNGNGLPDADDARTALRCAVKLESSRQVYCTFDPLTQDPESGKWRAGKEGHAYLSDCDGDGRVTSSDARTVLRRAVGLDGYLPLQADDGVYRMLTEGFDKGFGALEALSVNSEVSLRYSEDKLPLWRITSTAELQNWLAALRQEMKNDTAISSFLYRYGDGFFETRDLFICFKEESSYNLAQAVYPAETVDGVYTLSVGTAYLKNHLYNEMVGDWFLFQPAEKAVTQKCSGFACKQADALCLESVSAGIDAIPPSADIFRTRDFGLHYDYRDLGALTALELNAAQVTDRNTEDFPLWRISSEEEFDAWITVLRNEAALPVGVENPSLAKLEAFRRACDRAFFEENDLFVCYHVMGSGSYFTIVDPPAVSDGTLTFTVHRGYVKNAAGTCDMAQYFLFIPVEKSVASKCTAFACKKGDDIGVELDF